MTKRKRVTLEFFNQLREPERSQAIENYDNAASNTVPDYIENAIMSGFDWEETPQGQGHKYWENIWESLIDKTYWPPVVFSIEDLANSIFEIEDDDTESMIDLQEERKQAFIFCYNKLKELGKIKL